MQLVDQAEASLGPATSVLAKDSKELSTPFDGETADGKSLHLAYSYLTPHSYLPISWLERKPSQEMLFRFNNTIAPLLEESYIDESFGASVIFLHVLHRPNVLRVKHDGPCQP